MFRPVAVFDLQVGVFVMSDGPHAEFQGGTLVSKEPHPDFPGAFRLTFEREVMSRQQGWLTTRKTFAPDGSTVVQVETDD